MKPPCSARPFTAAPMACSRTPKWRFRPSWPHAPPTTPCAPSGSAAAGSKSPCCLSQVKVDGLRSAEPPTSSGRRGASACITASDALRVASPLASAAKPGRPASQPGGQLAARGAASARAPSSGMRRRDRRCRRVVPVALGLLAAARPRCGSAPRPRAAPRTPARPASRGSPWRRAARRARAGSRVPRRCSACAARRSR